MCAQPKYWDHPADFKFRGLRDGRIVLSEVEYGALDSCCADDVFPQHLQYITEYLLDYINKLQTIESGKTEEYTVCKECGNECLCHEGFYECQVCGNTGWEGE